MPEISLKVSDYEVRNSSSNPTKVKKNMQERKFQVKTHQK